MNVTIDEQKVQTAANEAAERGYLKAVKDYFEDYGSPFQKQVKEELSKIKFNYPMYLPDFMSQLNTAMKAEIDRVVNVAIAQSYIPKITSCFINMPKLTKLSEIIRELVIDEKPDTQEYDKYSLYIDERNGYKRLYITCMSGTFDLTLFTDKYGADINDPKTLFHFISMPDGKGTSNPIRIIKDDVTIELPATPSVLNNKFTRLVMNMLLANTLFSIDINGIDEETIGNYFTEEY